MKAQDRGADWKYIIPDKNPQILQKQVGVFPSHFPPFSPETYWKPTNIHVVQRGEIYISSLWSQPYYGIYVFYVNY